MTFVGSYSAAGARTAATRRLHHVVVASLTAVLVVALSAASASADSIGDTQARAAALGLL